MSDFLVEILLLLCFPFAIIYAIFNGILVMIASIFEVLKDYTSLWK